MCRYCWINSTDKKAWLLYSWSLPRYSAPIHWLVHFHMTSNNETVSRKMPRAGNIAKTVTSNRKQFTVTRCCTSFVNNVILNVFHRFDPFALLYKKLINDWSLGADSELCVPRISKPVNNTPNGSWFTSFSRVLPTYRVVYCASKPIETVVCCLKTCNVSVFAFPDFNYLTQSLEKSLFTVFFRI